MREKCTKPVRAFLLTLLLLASASSDCDAQVFLFEWGEAGNSAGQFYEPSGIAGDSYGSVYVADTLNNRIQKFDGQGTFISTWGSVGSEFGHFDSPQGIAVDSSDCIYVADVFNHRIQKFDRGGNLITAWGSLGSAVGYFDRPFGIAVDSSDNIYVADSGNDRVQKFDRNGTFISSWGTTGSSPGQFDTPQAIAIDLHATQDALGDSVYVGDANNRIQRFDPDGVFVAQFGSEGRDDGQFADPMGIGITPSSHLIVSDSGNFRVQELYWDGGFITKWGGFGRGEGQFDRPSGVAVLTSGTIYVSDSRNDRIQVFGIPSAPIHHMADFNWSLSWSNNRVLAGNTYACSPASDAVGDLRQLGQGNTISFVLNGGSYSGFVDGANYQVSRTYAGINDEIVTEQLDFTLVSPTSGSGHAFTGATDDAGSYCLSEGDLVLTASEPIEAQPIAPVEGGGLLGGGFGGMGGGGCFIGALMP
jgi:DNA-binding beta-propeller fold protein YncE